MVIMTESGNIRVHIFTREELEEMKLEVLRRIYEQAGKGDQPINPKDLQFSLNALRVLENRYLLKDVSGRIIETPQEMFWRVARHVARAERKYGATEREVERWAKAFYEIMSNLEFLPNSPTLMNAGTDIGQLSACFVIPIEDDLESIFDAVKYAALIHKTGGGTGFSFSKLRPEGDIVRSTAGVASGPVSFMKIFDVATEVIKQGGRRRGANMGVLRVDHPDIEKFVRAKEKEGEFQNFNLSVAVTDDFMRAVEEDGEYWLINPRTGEKVRKVRARYIFNLMVECAWKTGDPGLIFIDEINRKHPVSHLGKIEATNPCITADTWIMTDEGPRMVKDLIGRRFTAIVNGEKWPSGDEGFFATGVKKVYMLKTKEGFELRLTKDHPVLRVKRVGRRGIEVEWVKAGDLKPGDKILMNNHRNLNGWNGKYSVEDGYLVGKILANCAQIVEEESQNHPSYVTVIMEELGLRTCKRVITEAMEKASSEFCKGLLRGLFDVNGLVERNESGSVTIRLSEHDLDLLKAVQRILLRFGIFSRIRAIDGGNGRADRYELTITDDNVLYFYQRVGFGSKEKMKILENAVKCNRYNPKRELFLATVEEVAPCGEERVYDVRILGLNAFDANGFYVHNCGEQPLLPWESCNLGSINLGKFVEVDGKGRPRINWERMKYVVELAVRFLDNVIDVNRFPIRQIEIATLRTRKIGLGVMGWADMLIKLGIPYDSEEALSLAEKVMKFITETARNASVKLGEERGNFPAFPGSLWEKLGYRYMRNATVTTIAPTGSISIIAGASSGIEPLFAIVFVRNILGGMIEINPLFEEVAKKRGFYSKELLLKIVENYGSVQGLEDVPEDVQRIFKTAHDIDPEWHVRMQAAFQKYVDNAVSKTVNLRHDEPPETVAKVFMLAWKLKCKGITVYRDKSKKTQVIFFGGVEPIERRTIEILSKYKDKIPLLDAESAGGCKRTSCLLE